MTVPAVQGLSEVVESKSMQDTKVVKSSISSWCRAHWRKIFSEFLVTLMLILLGCMTCIPVPGYESPLYGAVGFGMVVMFNIQIFGHISGAYMNPAVAISSVIYGNISITLGIAYIIAECIGAIAGYGLLDALVSIDFAENAVCVNKSYPGQSSIQSMFIEVAITGALIFVNCAVWDPVNKDYQESVAIKFGLTVVGLSLAGGPFTGASINPARSLGPAVWTNIWAEHWVFWVGPILGSVIVTVLYKFTFLRKPKD